MTREKKAMGHSWPSTTWDSTAPIATSDASVSSMHGLSGNGNASVVASTKAVFNDSKDFCASSVQKNLVPFLVRDDNGSAIVAKFLTNFEVDEVLSNNEGLVGP